MKTLLLNQSEVTKLLNMRDVITAVEEGYKAFNRGQVIQPDIVSIEIPAHNGEMDVKSGYSENTGLISVKCASGFWDNQKTLGIPNSLSMVLLFDGTNGLPLCIMDGSPITGFRTGAAGAISAKLLARKNSKTVAVIGAGDQARMQVMALKEVLPIENVLIWSRVEQAMQSYKHEMEEQLKIKVEICETPEQAVRKSDIIVTTTPSKTAVICKDWVRAGTHIIAVGADMPGKQELDAGLFYSAKIVNDNIEQCICRGETQNPIKLGIIQRENIHAEIGQILLNQKPGRENEKEITIFDTTGMAIQDNVTAAKIYERALALQLGEYYEFMRGELK